MPIELYPKEALINAALMTRRPVAFLVGSPLSLQGGIGVPGVTTMLDFVRDEIRSRGSFALPKFEAAVNGKLGPDAYQEAMKWLGVNAGQDAINDVVAKAVRQARKADAGAIPAGTDGQADEWNIPSGTSSLAELVKLERAKFVGPILTTNFDPLISLAIKQSGGRAGRRVLAADGTLAGAAEDDPEIFSVVHLHGFWRDSDTLHTQAQLTNPRPKLKASLQRLLVAQPRTLIVAAYGGWDDVFTQALVEIMDDEQAKLDVIWCFYENDPAVVEQRYGKLLEAMHTAIVSNRFRPFGGIDCHAIFAEIAATLQGTTSPAAVASIISSPIAGWQLIAPPYLDSLQALNPDELIRYFDGAVPTWRHAVSPVIPRRQGVEKLTARFAQVAHDDIARSMHLIRAAGGEGKSTLLLQAAADVARAGGWSVLWRTSPKEGISPEQVANLDPARRWLIVADDADGIVPGLAATAEHISQTGRSGVHFLLATRDADWKDARGSRKPWPEWLDTFPDIVLRGISPDDAKAILTAWENAGPDGLRELGAIGDSAKRVAVFESAVRDSLGEQHEQARRHRPQEGSFFGGLLAVRFGQNGLRAHVRAFLQRLEHMHIEHGNGSLFDALLYVAACHGIGIPGIDERVLADLVDVPREWVQRYVLRPLGEEAAAVHSAGHVLTRHSQVAAAILVEAEETFQMDLAEVWARLVRQTVQTSNNGGVSYQTHSKILHAGPRLQRALPHQIPKERRKAIAIAAARADHEAQPERLGPVIGLAQTLRLAGQPDSATDLFRQNVPKADSLADADERIRSYWNEWGICEGLAGDTAEHRAAGAWLQGLSISDHLNPAPITDENVKLSCGGLGVAFGKLAQPDPDCPFAKARRSVAYLGRLASPDRTAMRYFALHDREADKLKTPHPQDVIEAIAWLTAGAVQAGRDLQDPFLQSLADPERVSFKLLRESLDSKPSSRAHSTPPTKPRKPPAHPASDEPIQFGSTLDGKIQAGIERVIREAWAAVPADTAPEQRLKIARQHAMRSISRLSPYIKRQVGARFQTENWKSLKSRDPRT
jgi:SIR2-like domain